MDRVNRILEDKQYQLYVEKNEAAEGKRIFCRHNMAHFLDVARIAMLMNVERALGIEKEVIYAAALLHDIGRFAEYADGTPHEEASAKLAPEILQRCGFADDEERLICQAIASHRDRTIAEECSLSGILYLADKASRSCHSCKARTLCKWSEEKKNMTIKY